MNSRNDAIDVPLIRHILSLKTRLLDLCRFNIRKHTHVYIHTLYKNIKTNKFIKKLGTVHVHTDLPCVRRCVWCTNSLLFEQLLLHDCQITLVDFSNGIVVGKSHVVVAVLQYFVNHTSVHFAIPVCLHMRPVFEC